MVGRIGIVSATKTTPMRYAMLRRIGEISPVKALKMSGARRRAAEVVAVKRSGGGGADGIVNAARQRGHWPLWPARSSFTRRTAAHAWHVTEMGIASSYKARMAIVIEVGKRSK